MAHYPEKAALNHVLLLFMVSIWRAVRTLPSWLTGGSSTEKAEAGADEPLNRSAEVEAFYVSWAYRKCRKAFAKHKGNLCERCLKKGIIEPGSKDRPLEVHHKIPLTVENIKNPDITLGWDNLELLCKTCHDQERERRQKRWHIGTDGHVTL